MGLNRLNLFISQDPLNTNFLINLTGSANVKYEIAPAPLVVFGMEPIYEHTYDNTKWEKSEWTDGEILGLEGFYGATVSGTVRTNDKLLLKIFNFHPPLTVHTKHQFFINAQKIINNILSYTYYQHSNKNN